MQCFKAFATLKFRTIYLQPQVPKFLQHYSTSFNIRFKYYLREFNYIVTKFILHTILPPANSSSYLSNHFITSFIHTGARCWWRSCLRHCATSRKVAGSIPVGFIRIFHLYNPSGRTMVLGLTQPLTEMSTRSISWG